MGTPRKDVARLESPTVAEKIQAIDAGKELGKNQNIENLSAILEKAKEFLLPLVQWLDKPFHEEQYLRPLPEFLRRKRGMRVFESSFAEIWIERSGMWFIRICEDQRAFNGLDSQGLAWLLIGKSDEFLRALRFEKVVQEFPFFSRIAVYDAVVLHLLTSFCENVNKLVEEREERLRTMRERMSLMKDFVGALDPMASQCKVFQVEEFQIWEEHERGERNCVSSYFSREALKPFWKILNCKSPSERSRYKEHASGIEFRSLRRFMERMHYIVDEINYARSAGRQDAKSQLGYNQGRLPLAEDELKVLRDFVASIIT